MTGGSLAVRVFALLATLCAAILFAYALRRAGTDEVLRVVASLGWWFVAIVLLAGLRLSLRAESWRRCFEQPRQIGFRRAWSGHVAGTSVGYLVPIGFAFGEALKAAAVRDRVPFAQALAAVAVANLFYILSLATFIVIGTGVLLTAFELPPALLIACRVTISVACLCVAGLVFVLARRGGDGRGDWVAAFSRRIGAPDRITEFAYKIDEAGAMVGGFCARHPSRVLPIALLEICFYLAGVAEVWITLAAGADVLPSIRASLALEATNAILNIIFGFVPLGIGVDEAGVGALATAVGAGAAAGVAIALVRKARTLIWAGVGVLLLIRARASRRGSAQSL